MKTYKNAKIGVCILWNGDSILILILNQATVNVQFTDHLLPNTNTDCWSKILHHLKTQSGCMDKFCVSP